MAIQALVFVGRHVWALVSISAVTSIVFFFGPRQMVEGIIIAAAVAVGALVGSLMSWGT